MNITVKKEYINSIPVLHIVKDNLLHEELPTVIFIHGITSAKEHNLHYAYYLAEKGIRVMLPDCLYHGERQEEITENNQRLQLWNIVIMSIQELDTIKSYLLDKGWSKRERIGVAGTSMGAIVTLGALKKYNWIHSAVSLMGSPAYVQFASGQIEYFKDQGLDETFSESELRSILTTLEEYDLSMSPQNLKTRPLLFWHGKKDPVVPYGLAFNFYQDVLHVYEEVNLSHQLQFVTDEVADHKVTREGVRAFVQWFETHLLEA